MYKADHKQTTYNYLMIDNKEYGKEHRKHSLTKTMISALTAIALSFLSSEVKATDISKHLSGSQQTQQALIRKPSAFKYDRCYDFGDYVLTERDESAGNPKKPLPVIVTDIQPYKQLNPSECKQFDMKPGPSQAQFYNLIRPSP